MLLTRSVKKMIEKGDYVSVANKFKTSKFKDRAKIMEILVDANNSKANETLNIVFSDMIQFGVIADKIEAITIMQGRVPYMLGITGAVERCQGVIPDERIPYLVKFEEVKFKKRLDLDIAQPLLIELANNKSEEKKYRNLAKRALKLFGENYDIIEAKT